MKRFFMWLVLVGAVICFPGIFWRAVGAAVGFLVLSVAQLFFIGDTDKEGSWVNGFHGLLALVLLVAALAYVQWAARNLGLRTAAGAAGSA